MIDLVACFESQMHKFLSTTKNLQIVFKMTKWHFFDEILL